MPIKTIPTEQYLTQIMGDKDSITSQDLPLENDTDYVMSIMIPMECAGNKDSGFKIELMDGETSKNGYTIPNMRISRGAIMSRIEEINALGEQILNQQALTDARQLGLQACTIAAQLAVENERLTAENKRMIISLDEAMDLISRQFKTLVAAMPENKRAEFTVALMQSELPKEREPQ